MTNAQMVAAILNAVQTDTSLIALIRALFPNYLNNCDVTKLQSICTALGINPSGS